MKEMSSSGSTANGFGAVGIWPVWSGETPIGREVMIDVVRDGDHETLTLTTAEHPAARRQAWRFIRPDGALTLENLDIVRDGAPRSIRVTLPDAGR